MANPYNSFYALANGGGGGGGSTLQSPASVTPDAVLGDVSLAVNSAAGATNATVTVIAGATGEGLISIGGGGNVYDISAPGTGGNQGHLQIACQSLQVGQTQVFDYNPVTGDVILGDSLPGGSVQIDSDLLVAGAPGNGNAIKLLSASAISGTIYNTAASNGTLGIGSSTACPVVITANDTAGVGTSFVDVFNNGSADLRLKGGASAGFVNPSVSTSAAGAATLNLGVSAPNPQLVFCTDPTGIADEAFVDITKGTATGFALRLQGYGTGAAATVSTNATQGGGGILNVTSGYNDATPAITLADASITMTRAVTMPSAVTAAVGYANVSAQLINGGASIGTTIFPLLNPSAIGLYNIIVRIGDNLAVNINTQISTVGFWNGSVWAAGGVVSSPDLAGGNLQITFGPLSTTRTTLYLQNTGAAELSLVTVYLIPQLLGLSGVILP